ncbi:MAG TPA: insulinase family protein [Opitutaceae bacterium]|jgi:zinc protease|nr:insulinase family protein [Opitutaceae bacterium]
MNVLRWPLIAALVVVAAANVRAAMPFPQQGSDLPPDPAARFGTLPNGLRYIVYPNHEPRDRVSLRLVVLAGSLYERDDQQGLAHFLEHMAFNGSAHYPPGTLIEFFQRNGMNFGGDTNAYTSFNHTCYKIELPSVAPASIDEGLRVFADFAGTLLLRPDMINKERPIILAEKRDRDSVDYREYVASEKFLLPDSLIPRRFPIGLTSVIEHAQRPLFEDLYNTWYRPERMTLIVVGDIDPARVIPRIAAIFAGVADRAPARPEPNLGTATVALGLRTGYYYQAEAPSTQVSIDVIAPYRPPIDSTVIRLAHLKRDLAVAMLNRRFDILSKKEGAPFIRAEAAIEEDLRFVHDAGINIECNPGQWRAALALAEQQLRGALTYGFSRAELREAASNFRTALEQAAAGAQTRRSPDVADEMVSNIVAREVQTSPAQDLALYAPALATLTPADCMQALRLAFGTPGRFVMVEGNAKIDGDAPAVITRAYTSAHAVPVRPPPPEGTDHFAYTNFGTPGQVVWRRDVPDLGITEVRFANGVRLNVKKTAFEADRIRIRVRVGAGRLIEPRTEPGLDAFTDLTFQLGGLGRHSADDLQRLLAGHAVGFDFEVGNDALEIAGATNRADLLLQMELIAAYMTDPGYRPESLRVASKNIAEFYGELAHSVEGPLQTVVPRLLADGDPRFGLPPEAVTQSRTLAEERAWVSPQTQHGPVEIGVAGDADVDTIIAAVARTLGALPARAPKPAYAEQRIVHFPAEAFTKNYAVPSEIPKAVVAAYWPTTDAFDVRVARRLSVLSEIFSDRLRVRIREQLGGAYSPEAVSEPSDTFTHYGFLISEVMVAPERAAEIERAVVAVANEMATQGVTDDQLKRAKEPILTGLRESARTNQYWLGAVIGSCQEFPQRLDWARSRYSGFDAITRAEIDALARRYLGGSHAFQVIVRPVPAH